MPVVRLKSLTGELLDLSRIESGAAQDKRVPVNLAELSRSTCESYASQAEQAGIEFSLDVPERAVVVNGDEAQLRRVLSNLLDNACKFTPAEGAVSVCLRRKDEWAELCVQDTGIGIPADDLPQLFGRFHRAQLSWQRIGSGDCPGHRCRPCRTGDRRKHIARDTLLCAIAVG